MNLATRLVALAAAFMCVGDIRARGREDHDRDALSRSAGHAVLRRGVPGSRQAERLDGECRRHQGRHRRRSSAASRTPPTRRSTRSSSTPIPRRSPPVWRPRRQAGVPVFGMDAGSSPLLVANVTSNGYEMAATTASYVVNRIGGKGGVVMFVFDAFPPVQVRGVIADAIFKNTPDIKIIDRVTPGRSGRRHRRLARQDGGDPRRPSEEGLDRGRVGGLGPAGARRAAGDRGGRPHRRRHRHRRHGRQSAGARGDRQGRQFRGVDGAGLQGHRPHRRRHWSSAISPARRSSRA